jgi:hypothetical protein
VLFILRQLLIPRQLLLPPTYTILVIVTNFDGTVFCYPYTFPRTSVLYDESNKLNKELNIYIIKLLIKEQLILDLIYADRKAEFHNDENVKTREDLKYMKEVEFLITQGDSENIIYYHNIGRNLSPSIEKIIVRMKFDHIPKAECEPEFIIKLSLSRKPTFLPIFIQKTLFIPIVIPSIEHEYFKKIFKTEADSNYFNVVDEIYKLDLINGLFRLFEILLLRFIYFEICIKSISVNNTSLKILVEKIKLKDTDADTKIVTERDTYSYTIFYTRKREERKIGGIGGINKKTIYMIDLNFFRNFMNKLYDKLDKLQIITDKDDFLLNSKDFKENAELSINLINPLKPFDHLIR